MASVKKAIFLILTTIIFVGSSFAADPVGNIKWTVPGGGNPAIDHLGNVYVSHNGVSSYDSDGNFRWTFSPEAQSGWHDPVIRSYVASSGQLIVLANCGEDAPYPEDRKVIVYGVSLHDGTEKWQHESVHGYVTESIPIIDKHGNIYFGDMLFFGMTKGHINKIDKNGNLLWRYEENYGVRWGYFYGAVAVTDNAVFAINSSGGVVKALNPSNGNMLQEYIASGYMVNKGIAVTPDGTALAASKSNFYAFDSGGLLWNNPGTWDNWAPPIVIPGRDYGAIYHAEIEGEMVKTVVDSSIDLFRLSDGATRGGAGLNWWDPSNTFFGGPGEYITFSPGIVTTQGSGFADRIIFYGSDGYLYNLRINHGNPPSVAWKLQVSSPVDAYDFLGTELFPSVANDGTIYATGGGNLYAIEEVGIEPIGIGYSLTDVVNGTQNSHLNIIFNQSFSLETSIVSVAADTIPPYIDEINDFQTDIVVSGENNMECRFGTIDEVYSDMNSGNECTIDGSEATCELGDLPTGIYIYYVSCRNSVGIEQTTSQNLNINFNVDLPPRTDVISVAGDTIPPYVDETDDLKTDLLISGENNMSCRFDTADKSYYEMNSINDCAINGSQATCELGDLDVGTYIYYVSCKNSVGREQTSADNLNIEFDVFKTSDYSLSASANPTVITADGKARSNITALLEDSGEVGLPDRTVRFSTDNGLLCLSSFEGQEMAFDSGGFSDSKIQITAGQDLTFRNNDSTPHTVSCNVFLSGTINPGTGAVTSFSNPDNCILDNPSNPPVVFEEGVPVVLDVSMSTFDPLSVDTRDCSATMTVTSNALGQAQVWLSMDSEGIATITATGGNLEETVQVSTEGYDSGEEDEPPSLIRSVDVPGMGLAGYLIIAVLASLILLNSNRKTRSVKK